MSVDVSKVVSAGMTFRPLAETVRDTLHWDTGRTEMPQPYTVYGITIPPGGISADREMELLHQWNGRH
jgi:hypothetical protein